MSLCSSKSSNSAAVCSEAPLFRGEPLRQIGGELLEDEGLQDLAHRRQEGHWSVGGGACSILVPFQDGDDVGDFEAAWDFRGVEASLRQVREGGSQHLGQVFQDRNRYAVLAKSRSVPEPVDCPEHIRLGRGTQHKGRGRGGGRGGGGGGGGRGGATLMEAAAGRHCRESLLRLMPALIFSTFSTKNPFMISASLTSPCTSCSSHRRHVGGPAKALLPVRELARCQTCLESPWHLLSRSKLELRRSFLTWRAAWFLRRRKSGQSLVCAARSLSCIRRLVLLWR